jgi:DNA/RNA endonuclease G (NUC1)
VTGARHGTLVAFSAVLLPCALIGPAYGQDQPANDPKHCSKIWDAVGLPRQKAVGTLQIVTVCHKGYIVGHNSQTKTPEWVIERLTPELTEGEASRENLTFSADGALEAGKRAEPEDYQKSGFDQGHQAAAADFAAKQDFLDDTFFLSNAVPQVGIGFNRSIWRSFETHVRKLVSDRGELYVITGPVPQSKAIKIPGANEVCRKDVNIPMPDDKSICAQRNENSSARCTAGVAVPAALYKIVYDPDGQRAFAVLLANESHTGKYKKPFDYIQKNRVGIGTIEDLTGLTFLTSLPERKQRQMKSSCVDVRFH